MTALATIFVEEMSSTVCIKGSLIYIYNGVSYHKIFVEGEHWPLSHSGMAKCQEGFTSSLTESPILLIS